MKTPTPLLQALLLPMFLLTPIRPAEADRVVALQNGRQQTMQGEILVEAEDGSILFRTRDSRLWILAADQIVSREREAETPEPMGQKELGEALLEELPEGFHIYETDHFVVAYQTERSYARWVGGLYERLLRGFEKYWEREMKFPLEDPKFQLTAIVFGNREAYTEYVRRELGSEPGEMVAYYNLMTNRVAMYDLTASLVAPGQAPRNDRHINEVLSNPNSIPMVATVIHEGTHQLMFNTGMQTRFSDTPLWINEGMAMYFETPDLRSNRGWRAIGKVNRPRLLQFRRDLAGRGSGALSALIADDKRFQNPETAISAYAEAWALNYYLLNERPEEFVDYLKFMSSKKPLAYDTPVQRLDDFRRFFGEDLNVLDRAFTRYMAELRE